jgi:RHS repeat-associated protein
MKNRIGHQVKNRSLSNRKEVKEVCNYEARYYNSHTFISQDALFEKYSFLLPYNYCANNPVNKIDPDDKWTKLANAAPFNEAGGILE